MKSKRVKKQVWDQVWDQVSEQVEEQVWLQVRLLKKINLKGKRPEDCQDEINKVVKNLLALRVFDIQVQVYRTVASFNMLFDKGRFPV